MSKTVTSTEAKRQFGSLLKWMKEKRDEVIVSLRGEPTAVIMSYSEYEALQRLRRKDQARKALAALDELRKEAQTQTPDLTAEEAYRLAGFSEDVIQETLAMNKKLAETEP